jgi:hypothetical protein
MPRQMDIIYDFLTLGVKEDGKEFFPAGLYKQVVFDDSNYVGHQNHLFVYTGSEEDRFANCTQQETELEPAPFEIKVGGGAGPITRPPDEPTPAPPAS